ncbi:SDR family NAD(P)-dependent oxidoreductase [Thermomicrobium sp. 4228-Ro]|uniref:SDR family oxidoreductase n=1 Tax=Thermomicrobium sp. 4228-Ro TaxID=2993937 RepID=UPI0022491FD6|nr:SDR family NAD(P)-dependent oxidoreductase [Thermomicrobium sp. 4228-Ro]MCX2726966.1 SDR family NAD(P)-dependent oxidoreductase [Thermomicrobium sp. 4228-Ro]
MTSEAPVALVTGGTGQVGSVVVRFFAERGARVFVPYRTLAHWEALRASLGPLAGSVAGAQLDLGSADDAERAVTSAIERYGRLDWVLCLAGGYRPGRIAETDPALWEELLAMNLWPTANVLRAAVPRLLERGTGRIVTVGARAALDPGAGSVAYAAVKQAVMTMTLAVAREVRGTGVTANCIAPATIDTPANREAMPNADYSKWVPREQVAALLWYLCSPEAAALNGAIIPIAGGQ